MMIMKNRYLMTLLLVMLTGCEKVDANRAQHYAEEYARKHYGSDATADCVRADTDGDGYLSCTVFVTEDGHKVEKQLQCGAEKWCLANCAEGCKVVETVKLQSGRQR